MALGGHCPIAAPGPPSQSSRNHPSAAAPACPAHLHSAERPGFFPPDSQAVRWLRLQAWALGSTAQGRGQPVTSGASADTK